MLWLIVQLRIYIHNDCSRNIQAYALSISEVILLNVSARNLSAASSEGINFSSAPDHGQGCPRVYKNDLYKMTRSETCITCAL